MSFRSGVIVKFGTAMAIVSMDSAVEKEKETALKTVCLGLPSPEIGPQKGADLSHPPTATRQSLKCPDCGNEDRSSFKKARVEGGAFTVVEAGEVVETKAAHSAKDLINLSVHRKEDVETQTIQSGDSVYYLTPSKPGYAPLYDLLRYAVENFPELTFLGEWTPTSRTQLFEFKLFGSTVVMEGRSRPEDLKVQEVPVRPVSQEHRVQLDALIPTLVKDFDPSTFADTYRTDLAALLATKETVDGQVIESAKRTTTVAPVGTIDITAMLAGALAEAAPAPAKKAAARKPRAKSVA